MTPGEVLWVRVAAGEKVIGHRLTEPYVTDNDSWGDMPETHRIFWEREAEVLGAATQDPVTRPAHYTTYESGVECITITEHMNFCVGNAMKYLWRAGRKSGESELKDLKKAAWYIAREIARREKKEAPK